LPLSRCGARNQIRPVKFERNDMSDSFDKWLTDARKAQGGMINEAMKRETLNDQQRAKQTKLDGLKDYQKSQQREAAKTAKLRDLRLAKEAQDRVDAATAAAAKPAPKARRAKKDPTG
jgi:hypothetical protein